MLRRRWLRPLLVAIALAAGLASTIPTHEGATGPLSLRPNALSPGNAPERLSAPIRSTK